jgi:hypothetical protein
MVAAKTMGHAADRPRHRCGTGVADGPDRPTRSRGRCRLLHVALLDVIWAKRRPTLGKRSPSIRGTQELSTAM